MAIGQFTLQGIFEQTKAKTFNVLTLAELQTRFAVPGRVDAIWLRAARGEPAMSVASAELSRTGLVGDRARAGKRAVTLIQAEHLPVIAELAGLEAIDPGLLRRNIVVSGFNIAAFRGRQLRLGDAVIEMTVPCHPCSKMETVLGFGGYTAMRGHGGMCAVVVQPGKIKIGSEVVPMED